MQSQFTKIITFNNKSFNLCAKFKFPTGWIGFIQDKCVSIPKDKCHVSPSFDDDVSADKSCWTKNSVLNFLEKTITEKNAETKYTEQGVSKNHINYFVTAKFCADKIGWRGHIKTNYGEMTVQIPQNKCHVSPHFDDSEEVDNKYWTKTTVLRHLHEIANEI